MVINNGWSYAVAIERSLERRDAIRNKQITKQLAGRLKPPDEYIIKNLKEKTWKTMLENVNTADTR